MRYAIAALVVVLAVGTLAAIKWSQIATLMAHAEEAGRAGPPPEAVSVRAASEQVWEESIDAIGTVASQRDVTISNEVPGVVAEISFDSGDTVSEGDVLVSLDTRVERADLASAIAAEELALATVTRTRRLLAQGAIAAEENDRAQSTLDAAIARVAMMRGVIARKVIRAPVEGRVGIRAVYEGQFLPSGTTITELGSTEGTFVDFTVPQQRVADLHTGMRVRLRAGEQTFSGSIDALEPVLNENTRSVGVRASVDDPERLLRPGMFLDVEVISRRRNRIVAVPATAIVHAPYGDSVFVIERRRSARMPDGTQIFVARQRFVQVGERRGDFAAVRRGLRAGQRVVTAGAFKLRNGSLVYVAPSVGPQPSLTPNPPNR